jgi:hypothetical protein
VGELFPTLINMNTIPVIFHQEDNRDAERTMLKSKDLNTRYIPFCKTSKDLQKEVGIVNASFECHLKAMVACNIINLVVGEKKRKLKLPFKVQNPMSQFGIVIIEKGVLKKKISYSSLEKRIDFGLLINDVESKSISSESISMLKKYFPNVHCKQQIQKFEIPKLPLESLEQILSPNILSPRMMVSPCVSPSIPITFEKDEEMENVLSDDLGRYFFKAHAFNEHSIESILFIEQVHNLFSLYSKKRLNYQYFKLKEIYETFLNPKDAMMLIHVPEKLSNLVLKHLKSFEESLCDEEMLELFIKDVSEILNVLVEFVKSTLSDTYSRFKTGKYYQDYKKGFSQEMVSYFV